VEVADRVPVRASRSALELLEEIAGTHPRLYLLLDDSGCCGPGNVFLQSDPPRAVYRLLGWVGEVPVYAEPRFLRGAGARDVALDVRASPVDDSFSLEAGRGWRFTVAFDSPKEVPAGTN